MSDISKIKVSSVEYDIKDIQAREDLGNLGTRVTELEQHGGGGGSTVELDTTLSEAGKAADAKAVGDALAGKQNTISDLEAIRSGAAKGATALQSVPKPLTYDYMPEGYPKKTLGTVTVMEEQELTFANIGGGFGAASPVQLDISDGENLTVVWDGVSYDTVVTSIRGQFLAFGNPGLLGTGEMTDCPFAYFDQGNGSPMWATADTATSHTISVKKPGEIVTPIDEKYLPKSAFTNADWDFVSNRPIFNKPLNINITAENIVESINIGNNYVDLGATVPDFNEGLYYKVEGEVAFLNNSADVSYPLQINGYYKANSLAEISLGTVYDGYSRNNLRVSLYGNNSISSYMGRLCVNSGKGPRSYTITANFTIISEVKQLSEDYIPNTIQRVGDDIILSSSTAGSTKKYKITVDDSGTLSATEVTE